ncbi:MAG: hypothetical protein R6V84_10980 [Desulfobacterales bacterium]
MLKMSPIPIAVAVIFSSLALCFGASAGDGLAPASGVFKQASFNPGSDVSPAAMETIRPSDAALSASANQALRLASSEQQNEPSLLKSAPQAAGKSQPLSMLILGAGMIGLAGLGRRRFKTGFPEKSTAFDTSKKIVYENG